MHFNGISLDTYALCGSLTASSSLRNVEFGRQIHSHVEKSGWLSSVFVGSALVDLYAKLSLIADAALMFDEIPVKNSVCANALLSGFCEANLWVKGLELVRKMPELSLDYDHFTLSAILRSCAGLSAVQLGRQVHGYLIRKVYNLVEDVFLHSSLVEMYGKCGLVVQALQVFSLAGLRLGGEKRRDVVLWTSMLGVYGRNGHFEEVVLLFKEMLKEGIKPDEVAFVTVISACRHTGQIGLGLEYFDSLTHVYKLNPGLEHYSCVVDLLCRAGQLDKAMKLVNEMLQKGHNNGSVPLWVALLSACCDHENVELGKFAAQKALELDPQNVGIYVQLSNLYARFGMWDEIGQLRELHSIFSNSTKVLESASFQLQESGWEPSPSFLAHVQNHPAVTFPRLPAASTLPPPEADEPLLLAAAGQQVQGHIAKLRRQISVIDGHNQQLKSPSDQ
ncbi:hypothetical protein DITRI_Ditri08aG0131500 [Diplodiscus trichospermus]